MFCKLRKGSGEKQRPGAVIASAAAALVAGVAVALADGGGKTEGGEDASSPWLLVAAVAVPAGLLVVLGVMGFLCWRRKQER
jgi:hypothetical protein